MTDATIVIGAGVTKARQPIVIELVGEQYAINPPKTLAYMEFMDDGTPSAELTDKEAADRSHAMIFRWIDMAFGERADEVKGRLTDNDDSLDLDHINYLIDAIQKHLAGGVPPTPPSD